MFSKYYQELAPLARSYGACECNLFVPHEAADDLPESEDCFVCDDFLDIPACSICGKQLYLMLRPPHVVSISQELAARARLNLQRYGACECNPLGLSRDPDCQGSCPSFAGCEFCNIGISMCLICNKQLYLKSRQSLVSMSPYFAELERLNLLRYGACECNPLELSRGANCAGSCNSSADCEFCAVRDKFRHYHDLDQKASVDASPYNELLGSHPPPQHVDSDFFFL